MTPDLTDQGGKVQLRLGHDPLTLPGDVAELLIDLRDSVPPWTAEDQVRWLFPSKQRAGQHIHKRTLGDGPLRYGIRTTPLRGAALINLAGKIPVGPLSDLTGISNQAAGRWAGIAGSTWDAHPNSELCSPHAKRTNCPRYPQQLTRYRFLLGDLLLVELTSFFDVCLIHLLHDKSGYAPARAIGS